MREHAIKTTLVFLPADGETYWLLLPSSVSLLSGGTVQLQNTCFNILKVSKLYFAIDKKICKRHKKEKLT